MSSLIQRSFAGGELAPSLFARVDTLKYSTGARTIRNKIVMRHGGTQSRPGTTFVGEVKDSTKTVRLLPFVFNADNAYAIELGHLYIRFIKDGAHIKLTAQNITGVSNAATAVLTYSGSDTYANGDHVYITGILGALGTYLNGRTFIVAGLNAGANTFQLNYLDGSAVNSTLMGAWGSGGTVEELYTVVSTFVESDLADIQYVQSGDVITLTHPDYPIQELSRTSDASWALANASFSPLTFTDMANALWLSTNAAAGTGGDRYVVTAIDPDTGEESLQSHESVTTNATATSGAPITLLWFTVTNSRGHNIEYFNCYKRRNGLWGFIGTAGPTSLIDNGIVADTTDTPPVARDPFALETAKIINSVTQANPVIVTTTSAHGYKTGDIVYISGVVGMTQLNGNYYRIVVTTTTKFSLKDRNGTVIDTTGYTAYTSDGTSQRAGNYPATCTYIQQRLGFANSRQAIETAQLSRTGLYHNFSLSTPSQDDDAIAFTMAGRQVNEIKHLVDIGNLIIFTGGGEWAAAGGGSGAITPSDLNLKQYSYYGSSNLAPIVIGGNALFVQARGSVVRDLLFENEVQGYRGNDLTIFAAHLFDGYELVDWHYQQIPHSVVWAVRDDGELLGLTYIREHSVWGWHHHDTLGAYENVCSIPEGTEDAVYTVVNRTINGATKRYIERSTQRRIDDIKDFVGMDCALTYDGRSTGTMTLTEYLVGGWTQDSVITCTSSVSTFLSTDVENEVHVTGADGTEIRVTISEYVSATVVRGTPQQTVPVAMRTTALSSWSRAVDSLSGLWHLEGQDVAVFADGFVAASPNNDSYTVVTVASGAITLDDCYGVIHVGLPYIYDLETLNIDTVNGETIVDKKKMVSRVTLTLEQSRGIWVGAAPPTDDDEDPLEGLNELKLRDSEDEYDAIALFTGTEDVNIRAEWNSNGRVFIRGVDPVPCSILSVAVAGLFPFKGGG